MPDVITPGSVAESYEKTAATPGGAIKVEEPGKRRGCCSPLAKTHWLIGGGALMAIFAIVYGSALPSIITNKIEDGVATCKESDIRKTVFLDNYGDCKDCTPYYYNLHTYNVTNALDYLRTGAKLQLQEVGPYAFRRRQIRLDVKLSDDKSEVSYKQYTYHTFLKEKSCSTCSDTDEVITIDTSYLNVIAQAGGELGYLRRLAAGTIWGRGLNASDREVIIQANKEQMMKWSNGLNSNSPAAWNKLGGTILGFLSAGVSSINNIELEGFEYNGVFSKRTISEYALGFPSILAGIGLGTNYVGRCANSGGFNEQCANCTAATCPQIWSECKRCASGARVVSLNPQTCGRIVKKYTAVYGEDQASVVNSTCGLCESVGVCVAPMPGWVESSGLDFSKNPPNPAALNTYIWKTGCDNFSQINEYVQYNGLRLEPIWADLGARRNPTLAELNAFAVYGNCDAPTANMTCTKMQGNDGTSTPPRGAKITGFPDEVKVKENVIYLLQGRQNISVFNTNKTYDLDGAKLTRFQPPKDLVNYTEFKGRKGTATPVDGIQNLAFNVGFLAYSSYPLYLWGDRSLLDNVELKMLDGVRATRDTMYDAEGNLKPEYAERFETILDYEPGTGKAMRARKRMMASYALAQSQFTPNVAMSDVLWPNATAEVIVPIYFGEESATITNKRLKTYKTIKRVLTSLLPVLIIGIVVGLGLSGWGVIKRRRVTSGYVKGNLGEAV